MGKITINIHSVSEKAEFPLVFLLLFLPSYLNQQSLPYGFFDYPLYTGQVMLQSLLIFFLIRYLMQKQPLSEELEETGRTALSPILRFSHGFLALGGLITLYFLYTFLFLPTLQGLGITDFPEEPVLITKAYMLFPALMSCFAAAAMEEFFFRGYAFFRIRQAGISLFPALLTANIIFAAGHLYEGLAAAGFALVSGLFLSLLVLRKISLFSLTAAHGIFNFGMILISYLRQLSS
ncbi:CPBP family intramembrane glutamic endopeptidase [Oceanispirochaeta sp.]|uniref:CPBP family intramembrane glutamic endopeptidase n=1 Tax=Oceanispirochaeta sp. TaxID=2035350 RepID=UPI002632E152|nr:CPBP family intramembrane glutamic endopeptidase [Oceanispirochaeta sp.]MDA3956424.1 CPBP family intramembrane metalloprotease [Oceanispirochaeta sp.]